MTPGLPRATQILVYEALASTDPALAYLATWIERLQRAQPRVGAELGVAGGIGAAVTLALCPSIRRHDLVDLWWTHPEDSTYAQSGDVMATYDQASMVQLYHEAMARTAFAADRRRVLRLHTAAAALRIEDPLDYVFLDADHSAQGVYYDLKAWWPLLRPGGLCMGHDWGRYGVRAGVERFAAQRGLALQLHPQTLWELYVPDIHRGR